MNNSFSLLCFPMHCEGFKNIFQTSDCCFLIFLAIVRFFSFWYSIISWHIKEISLTFYNWDFTFYWNSFHKVTNILFIKTHKQHISEAERPQKSSLTYFTDIVIEGQFHEWKGRNQNSGLILRPSFLFGSHNLYCLLQ